MWSRVRVCSDTPKETAVLNVSINNERIMIEAVIMTVSGIFYPIAVLPVAVQYFSKIIPATYALEGIRLAVINGASIGSLWNQIWPLIIIGIVAVPLGDFIFRLAEKHAKRTGKLKRDG